VSKRVESIVKLQERGCRTFGMVCPRCRFAMRSALRCTRATKLQAFNLNTCGAEVIDVRGESMVRTVKALRDAGFTWKADELKRVSQSTEAWEEVLEKDLRGARGGVRQRA